MNPSPSDIEIIYWPNGGEPVNLARYVIFSTATFEAQANAVPGQFSFTLRDPLQEFDGFTIGAEIQLYVDGRYLYGGILMQVTRQYAFPAVDTTNVESVSARQWVLSGLDYNIWFDKRVFRDLSNPTSSTMIIPGVHTDRQIIRNYFPTYIDMPPGINLDDEVDAIAEFGNKKSATGKNIKAGWAMPSQGSTWRQGMQLLAQRSGAVYYIDAEKRLHFHALEDVVSPWALVDRNPNGVTSVGVRDVIAREDGSPIVTDALVWGGLEELASDQPNTPSGTFFARYPRSPARDAREQAALDARAKYGRWQYAEPNFQRGDDQESVDNRAEVIVSGPPGTATSGVGGLRYPVWEITCTWFAHEVPEDPEEGGRQHLKPGHIANIILYVMGKDVTHPLVQFLPLRSVQITFPQIPAQPEGSDPGNPVLWTYVQFTGQFGLSYSDPRALWKFLLENKTSRKTLLSKTQTAPHATNNSSTASFGGFGAFFPKEQPNGSRTLFSIPFPYLAGTLRVYLNGLIQRRQVEYVEEDPASGEFRFYTAPLAGDEVYVEVRTGQGENSGD